MLADGGSSKDRRGGRELDHQSVGVLDAVEPVVAIEAVRVSIDRVHDDHAAACTVGGFDDPLERVEEELGAEPLTVERLVEREATDQVSGHAGVAGAEGATGKFAACDLRRRDRVVGDDGAFAGAGPYGRP